ncbi:hypothetical protein MED193_19064 [Roseobacter sp. MED193]|nr:hypothetical protein MED193_19064 [Roseobacter sp. MED193]
MFDNVSKLEILAGQFCEIEDETDALAGLFD